jgi:hypothetical protein
MSLIKAMKTIEQPTAKTRLENWRRPERRRSVATLRFSPTAWAKLHYLRDLGPTEIGGFGVSTGDDLLRVDEIHLVNQLCSPVTVKFVDLSVADYFETQVDRGLRPEQFGRVWVHTHPGDSPRPTGTDEATFASAFGRTHWAVMFILARGGATYARLGFNVGPGGSIEIPAEIDFSQQFTASDWAGWAREYEEHVRDCGSPARDEAAPPVSYPRLVKPELSAFGTQRDSELDWLEAWPEYAAEEFGVHWADE